MSGLLGFEYPLFPVYYGACCCWCRMMTRKLKSRQMPCCRRTLSTRSCGSKACEARPSQESPLVSLQRSRWASLLRRFVTAALLTVLLLLRVCVLCACCFGCPDDTEHVSFGWWWWCQRDFRVWCTVAPPLPTVCVHRLRFLLAVFLVCEKSS